MRTTFSTSLLQEHNNLLRSELGSNSNGDGRYLWARAGECTYLAWTGGYDYTATGGGLMVPTKHLEQKKMCPHLDDKQWVLMFWEEHTPALWFQFGKSMYGFTNVDLDQGIEPWTYHHGITFTDYVIGLIKEQRKKTRADWDNEFDDKDKLNQKHKGDYVKDVVADACSAFVNPDPGSHAHHVEFGGVGESRPFIQETVSEDSK